VKFSTGLLNDHFELAGRVSALKSDGYVDRASSDLKSYFLQGTYVGKTTLIKALAFGGTENLSVLERIRRLRYTEKRQNIHAGIYTDEFGKLRFTIMKPIIISKIITSCIGMKS
jgi:iron complex outermembrane receptor protein